jgi:hypothetical protein
MTSQARNDRLACEWLEAEAELKALETEPARPSKRRATIRATVPLPHDVLLL